MELPLEIPAEFLRPIVTNWMAKLEAAQRARQSWSEQASECRMFYNRSAAAMWNPEYSKKFWKGIEPPRFRIALNLAYEYVAVFAPYLMWDLPHRTVEPKRSMNLPPSVFGGEQSPLFSAYQQETAMMRDTDTAVAWFMQDWLNYCAGEMPQGGLMAHSELSLVDALLTGRGTQWSRPYKMAGSQRTLVGSFYEAPERLLIDPDFNNLRDARWIGLLHIDHHNTLEKRFGHPENSLKGRATLESTWQSSTVSANQRLSGQSSDLIVWWEIWSKCGAGARNTDINTGIRDNLERTLGDYCYLCVSSSIPFPLNCSADFLKSGATPEDVKRKFAWPVPTWTDNRWPVNCLDFYANTDPEDPGAAWPLPPLAPAMGEIKFLNFLIPWLANRIWSSSRDFWAVLGPHYDHYLKYLRDGSDQTVIPTPAMVDDVRKAISVLQQPETRADAWRIVDVVMDLFRRRTGLIDFAYGMNQGGTQERTAEGVMAKREFVSARPDYMQKKVVAYHGELASLEAFITRLFVTGQDVQPRYGQIGAMAWEQLIRSTDVELVVRQMDYTVAASSVRRPNRDRDIANFGQFSQYYLGLAQQYAQATGNWEPVNGLIDIWGELHDMRVERMMFPPPQPDPQMQAMQQQQFELEQAKLQADVQKAQAGVQKSQMDIAKAQMDAEIAQQTGQANIMAKMLDLEFSQAKAGQDLQVDAARAQQDLVQDREKHLLDMVQDRQKFMQTLQQTDEMGTIKAQQARKMAAAKPTTNGNGGKK